MDTKDFASYYTLQRVPQTLLPMRVEVEWVDGQTRWVELQVRFISPSDPSITPGETGLFRRQPPRVSIPFHCRLEATCFGYSFRAISESHHFARTLGLPWRPPMVFTRMTSGYDAEHIRCKISYH